MLCIRNDDISQLFKKPFAYYMSDASWGELTKQLKYKCDWYGKRLVEIDASYPSAQLCSACGYKNTELARKRSQTWICPKCGAKHNRAQNAALNTLAEGLRMLNIDVNDANGTGGQPETLTLAENA